AKEIFGSNLVLANREARLTAPSGEDLSGQNAWAALGAANHKVGQFSESQIVVGDRGIEPRHFRICSLMPYHLATPPRDNEII
ncbi:MAG: hypothetical protein QMD77_05140, partial [Patescibacteria group bacterium]|nr:hypothetical protein [Patescibacteria group bacterium]